MTHKRFDHPNDALKDMQGFNGVMLPDGVSVQEASEELYNRVGARFEVKWEPWSPAEPIVVTETHPSGVSEADVKTALTNMKADGYL